MTFRISLASTGGRLSCTIEIHLIASRSLKEPVKTRLPAEFAGAVCTYFRMDQVFHARRSKFKPAHGLENKSTRVESTFASNARLVWLAQRSALTCPVFT